MKENIQKPLSEMSDDELRAEAQAFMSEIRENSIGALSNAYQKRIGLSKEEADPKAVETYNRLSKDPYFIWDDLEQIETDWVSELIAVVVHSMEREV